jgi:hypothetical protein
VVEIGIGQHQARDRRLPDPLARMELRGGFDLHPQVGRRAQKKPRAAILTDCNLGLSARLAGKFAASHGAAILAGAIPLRKRASGRRTKNLHLHLLRVYNLQLSVEIVSEEPAATTVAHRRSREV